MYKTTVKNVLLSNSGLEAQGVELHPSAPDVEIVETKVLSGIITDSKISALIEACK